MVYFTNYYLRSKRRAEENQMLLFMLLKRELRTKSWLRIEVRRSKCRTDRRSKRRTDRRTKRRSDRRTVRRTILFELFKSSFIE